MADQPWLAPEERVEAFQANRLVALRLAIVVLVAGLISVVGVPDRSLETFAIIMWACTGLNLGRCLIHGARVRPERLMPLDAAAAYAALALGADILAPVVA